MLALRIEGFNPLVDVRVDSMHLFDQGMVKTLATLTFNVPDAGGWRRRIEKPFPLLPLYESERPFQTTALPSEFPREVRNLDIAGYTASEFRSLGQFLFLIPVTHFSEKEHYSIARLWARMGYLMRAMVLPNPEFQHVNRNEIKATIKAFYSGWTRTFGKLNSKPNLHLVSSHLPI